MCVSAMVCTRGSKVSVWELVLSFRHVAGVQGHIAGLHAQQQSPKADLTVSLVLGFFFSFILFWDKLLLLAQDALERAICLLFKAQPQVTHRGYANIRIRLKPERWARDSATWDFKACLDCKVSSA